MVVRQGDMFWANLGPASDSTPAGRRPVLVVQADLFNSTRLNTVVVVALTTSARRRDLPGNVAFKKGEANLPRGCAANVTQLTTLDRGRLLDKVGTVSRAKMQHVLDGVGLVLGM